MTARDRTILMVVAALVAVAAFWFLAIKPKRAEIGTLNSQVATQTERLQTAQATVASGVAAKAAYPKDYATVTELGKALPVDDDLPSLLYQLDSASHGEHIDFESITRGAAAATSPGSTPPTSGTGTTGTGTAGTSTAGTRTGATGTAATGTAALPPGATVGTAGLVTLPFSFTFNGSFFGLQRFLGVVQDFVRSSDKDVSVRGRLLTINGVSLVPGEKGMSRIEAKIAATAYLAPPTGSSAAPSTTGPGTGTGAGTAPTSSAITGGSTR